MEEVVKAISNQRPEFKILWNHSLPINQLPYELLVYIFFIIHSEYEFDSDVLLPKRQGPEPVVSKLMGTCRRWREVIVGTPTFWCVTDLAHRGRPRNRNWTELCLSRSFPAPIELWARIGRHPNGLEVAYPLVYRIQKLYFTLEDGFSTANLEQDWVFRQLFGNGPPVTMMPALEKLDLVIAYSIWPRADRRLPIDADLSRRRFPHLRSLSLAGMFTPQDAALYTDLTELSLTTCSHGLSTDQFLGILAQCNQLEKLCLEDTLDCFSDDWMQRDPVPRRPLISFPRLNTFVVSRHKASSTSRFLAHIRVRASARLEISADIHIHHRGPTDVLALAGMLPPQPAVTLEPLAAVHAVKVWMCCFAGFRTIWVRTERTPEALAPTACVSMNVALAASTDTSPNPFYRPADYGQGSVRELAGVLGRAPVTALEIVDVHTDVVESWAAVFRAFPRLERLSVRGKPHCWNVRCARGIENVFLGLHAASEPDSEPTTGGPDSDASALALACPNLRHVSVDGWGTAEVYVAIRTCIEYRAGRGAVLGQLDLNVFRRNTDASPELCRACIEDIVRCTGRLQLRETNKCQCEGKLWKRCGYGSIRG